ncbi:MAG: type II toxin-antitoxin system ParD family antitoxin [Acidobacteriota bacterium]|nr:type II toxin-antitoxin system ParD family antitoxin [Acidobacteriota bacterium]
MATTINISLPEPLKTYVDAQIEAGDFGTPSQYIRELILDDRDRHRRNLEEHLLSALKEEQNALEIPDEVWDHGDIVGTIIAHAERLR